jgi:hypothetical protein
MSIKSFQVILNNYTMRPFNARVENLTPDAFLRLIRISGTAQEISNECFADDVYYDDYRNVDFNNVRVIRILTPDYDPSLQTPQKSRNQEKIPEVPNTPVKRKRSDESEAEEEEETVTTTVTSTSTETVEDNSDESHVEQIFCRVCFGFEPLAENPIMMCDGNGRTCTIAYHQKCCGAKDPRAPFYCYLHKKPYGRDTKKKNLKKVKRHLSF